MLQFLQSQETIILTLLKASSISFVGISEEIPSNVISQTLYDFIL